MTKKFRDVNVGDSIMMVQGKRISCLIVDEVIHNKTTVSMKCHLREEPKFIYSVSGRNSALHTKTVSGDIFVADFSVWEYVKLGIEIGMDVKKSEMIRFLNG